MADLLPFVYIMFGSRGDELRGQLRSRDDRAQHRGGSPENPALPKQCAEGLLELRIHSARVLTRVNSIAVNGFYD